MQFVSKSVEETIIFGQHIASGLKGGEIIALYGGLGAGKTHFAKGVAKGLGVHDIITSPTFVLMQQYDGKKLKLYHCDMYRVNDENELYETGFFDAMQDSGGVCIIEWAENIKNLLQNNVINVTIIVTGQNSRNIIVKGLQD